MIKQILYTKNIFSCLIIDTSAMIVSRHNKPYFTRRETFVTVCSEWTLWGRSIRWVYVSMEENIEQIWLFSLYCSLIFLSLVGCQGQYGNDCLYPCPRNCLNGKCDKYTGQCLSCLPGYYGQLCTNGLFSINDIYYFKFTIIWHFWKFNHINIYIVQKIQHTFYDLTTLFISQSLHC